MLCELSLVIFVRGVVCKFVLNVFLGVKCYVVGQFSGYVKGNVLGGCWFWSRGLF